MDIELVSQKIEIPAWAAVFARVQEAVQREGTKASERSIEIRFEQGQADWSSDADRLIEFLDAARVPYNRTDTSEFQNSSDLLVTCERKRFTLQRGPDFSEIIKTEAKWTPGEDDQLSLSSLAEFIKEDDIAGMVERVKARAEACGMTMPRIDRIKKPVDDLLFTMSIMGNDLDLVQALATPERVNAPLLGVVFGTRALYESVSDADVALTAKLLACGARTDEYCAGHGGKTIAESCLEDDAPETEALRSLVRSARAREHAHDAIESIASAAAHAMP